MKTDSLDTIKIAALCHSLAGILKLLAGCAGGSVGLVNDALHSLTQGATQTLAQQQQQASAHNNRLHAFLQGATGQFLSLWGYAGLLALAAGVGLTLALYPLLAGSTPPPMTDNLSPLTASSSPIDSFSLLAVLAALVIQGYSLGSVIRRYRDQMKQAQVSKPLNYLKECPDQALADLVIQGVIGIATLLLAGVAILATMLTRDPFWDTLAAVFIAVIMLVMALWLGKRALHRLTDVRDRGAEKLVAEFLSQQRSVYSFKHLHSIVLEDGSSQLFVEIELTQQSMISGMLKTIASEKQSLLRKLPAEKSGNTQAQAFVTARSMVDAPMKRAGLITANFEQAIREQLPRISGVSIRVTGISPFQLPRPQKTQHNPGVKVEYLTPKQ